MINVISTYTNNFHVVKVQILNFTFNFDLYPVLKSEQKKFGCCEKKSAKYIYNPYICPVKPKETTGFSPSESVPISQFSLDLSVFID